MEELPLGFGMALAMHEGAMERFAALPPAQKQALLEQARSVQSKAQMQALVRDQLS